MVYDWKLYVFLQQEAALYEHVSMGMGCRHRWFVGLVPQKTV